MTQLQPPAFRVRQRARVLSIRSQIVNGKWRVIESIDPDPVRIMALTEGYAMVRYKGAMPFVVPVKRLRPYIEHEEACPGP